MKSASDPRHQLRRKVVKELFTFSFPAHAQQTLMPNTKEILDKKDGIDEAIKKGRTRMAD